MISIIDCRMGNVKALSDVYKMLDIPAVIVKQAKDLANASKMILPGVGAFDHAMERIQDSGMRQLLDELVLHRHVPVLGICVGMQILGSSSEEGTLPGLGWIDGKVVKFAPSPLNSFIRLPHMGWNNIRPTQPNALLQDLDAEARFYFLHSYFFQCQRDEEIIAVTDYYGEFSCAVNSRNIFGVQFHPEKSHRWGIKLLENFARM